MSATSVSDQGAGWEACSGSRIESRKSTMAEQSGGVLSLTALFDSLKRNVESLFGGEVGSRERNNHGTRATARGHEMASLLPRVSSLSAPDASKASRAPSASLARDVSIASKSSNKSDHSASRVTLAIDGMHCSSCSTAVEAALRSLPGVIKATVSLSLHQALVEYDSSEVSVQEIVDEVESCGFGCAVLKEMLPSRVELRVDGMTCSSCSSAVETALKRLDGVLEAQVDVLSHTAVVVCDDTMLLGVRELVEAVEAAGFEATLVSKGYGGGSHGAEPGSMAVSSARDINARETARYRRQAMLAGALTAPVFLIAMVFPMIPMLSGPGGVFEWIYLTIVFGFPLDQLLKFAFATPVQFGVGWQFHAGAYRALKARRANMDCLVSFGTNASYAYSMISIIHHHVMEHHVTGNYSPTDFFETSAMLITFVLLGKYLESSAKGKTSEAIEKLCEMAPPTAILVETRTDDAGNTTTTERDIDSNLIQKQDVLKILPGTRMPADGKIVMGSTFVDESMLTGESKPVGKSVGDAVVGGTLNAGGMVHIQAERVGSDTTLSQIVRLVEGAQLSKAPVQAVADRISAVFVPAVVSLSLLTTIVWWICGYLKVFPDAWIPAGHSVFLFALLFGIAVMVIACPCALGLATPTAVMVGTGVAASNGVLIKGGDVLEKASDVNVVVFDKTGTVTMGKPAVVDFFLCREGVTGAAVAKLAAALERSSEHPIASAVIKFERDILRGAWVSQARPSMFGSIDDPKSFGDARHGRSHSTMPASEIFASAPIPDAKDVEVIVGRGLSAMLPVASLTSDLQAFVDATVPTGISNVPVLLGSHHFMAEEGVEGESFKAAQGYANEMESRGCSCIYLAVNKSLLAVISIMDPIKPESRGVIAALHTMGISCVLLTGDNRRTAMAIGQQLGITDIHAEVLPGDKAAVVSEIQMSDRSMLPGRRGRLGHLGRSSTANKNTVAMVGDGVNDSPALAKADIGIAIGSGSDVAIEAADVVLVKSDLEDVLMALDLCRKTFDRIKWNYIWALGYNIVRHRDMYSFESFIHRPSEAGATRNAHTALASHLSHII